MNIEKVSYAGNPERVTEEPYDCIWVRLSDRKHPSPLTSQVLQWVDWRLQGALSRFILNTPEGSRTTFLPTMKRLSSPLVAMDPPGEVNWESFTANCKGMGISKVLVLCEE